MIYIHCAHWPTEPSEPESRPDAGCRLWACVGGGACAVRMSSPARKGRMCVSEPVGSWAREALPPLADPSQSVGPQQRPPYISSS